MVDRGLRCPADHQADHHMVTGQDMWYHIPTPNPSHSIIIIIITIIIIYNHNHNNITEIQTK